MCVVVVVIVAGDVVVVVAGEISCTISSSIVQVR